MLDCDVFYNELKASGISFFSGVPDSLLQDICAYITDHADPSSHIIAANEGGAVALAIGHYLATGCPGLVYMQNSGQGNAVNPLMSLADNDVYGIPMLLMIGWRGEPGHKDEPQHVKQGQITLALLETMGIPYAVLPDEESAAAAVLTQQVCLTLGKKQPVALIIRKGTFASYALKNVPKNKYTLSREEAIGCVTDALPANAAVVSTTGKASRELYECRDRNGTGHAKDFLTVGGMGHASQIALGIALAKKDRPVYCIDGDGAALMHMGSLGIAANQNPQNFRHILLNNGVHDSVGGQPTIGFRLDFCAVAKAMGYKKTFIATSRPELKALMPVFMKEPGPVFMELRISAGARDDLGRPKTTPAQNKSDFMGFLSA
jgi:phosphonopyruvate decarboxylase